MSRFVLITGDFVPTGGMDLANYSLADFLARTGHAVELVTHRAAPELTATPTVTTRRVVKPLGSYLLGSWPLAWSGRRAGRAALRAGGRVIANGGNCRFPDVNWVHYVHAAYRPTHSGGLARRAKAAFEYPMHLTAERAAVRAARTVVCNSERTRRDVVERLGVEPERAVTVYYGTDPSRFRPSSPAEREELRAGFGWPPDRPVVMFIGALGDRRKGFDTLLAAWTALAARGGWDPLLVVVGRGAELPSWQRRVEAAGLHDGVRFLGFRTDVPDLLRAADALVSPTRYEAYGLGVHEAICCGLPAFVSATAGIAERYPSELQELLLSDPDNATDLADRLTRWRGNLEHWRTRVVPFSATLRDRTWNDMGRDFLAAIGEPTS